MAGLLNKMKEVVTGASSHDETSNTSNTSTTSSSTAHGAPSTQGPHNTDAANRVDPRVDADGDGRAGYEVGDKYSGSRGTESMGAGVGHPGTGIGKNTTSTPLFGTKDKDNHLGHSEEGDLERYEQRHGHTTGVSAVEGAAGRESTHHSGASTTGTSAHTSGSGVGYGRNTSGSAYGQTTSTRGYDDSTTGTGSSLTSSSTTGTSSTATPHSSSLLNKLDPRVDNTSGSTTSGSTLTGNSSNTSSSREGGYEHVYPGLHSKDVISELKGTPIESTGVNHRHNLYMSDKVEDYEVGSGRHTVGDPNYSLQSGNTTGTGYGNTTGGLGSDRVAGSGTTGAAYGGANTTTSGPYNSNVANKLDPRVDSDRDGSTLH